MKILISRDNLLNFICGCDYCDSVLKIGNITALKLFKKYGSIEKLSIILNMHFKLFRFIYQSKNIFLMWKDKGDIEHEYYKS